LQFVGPWKLNIISLNTNVKTTKKNNLFFFPFFLVTRKKDMSRFLDHLWYIVLFIRNILQLTIRNVTDELCQKMIKFI
jgi:hypothetical protein